jgi:hypothetical protein
MPAPPELVEAFGLPLPPLLEAAYALEASASANSAMMGAIRCRTRTFSLVGLRG